MFVCICNGITERQIREEIARGATSLPELSAVLGIASGCGICAASACELLDSARADSDLRTAACIA